MANSVQVKAKCPFCKGDGIYESLTGSPSPCPYCEGLGYSMPGSEIDVTEIMADLDKCKKRLKKIMDKLEVLDD